MNTYDPEPKESLNTFEPLAQNYPLSSNCTINRINDKILIIDNVFSTEECHVITDFINKSPLGVIFNSRRKIVGTWPTMSNLIMKRCGHFIPKNVYCLYTTTDHRDDQNYWTNPTINPCWRMVKCHPQSSLSAHFDGHYLKSVDHKSIYTIMVYLSNNTDGYLQFDNLQIAPKHGRVVIFNQSLSHQGNLNSEPKFFIRSEIMYQRSKKIATPDDIRAFEIYKTALQYHFSQPELAAKLELEAFELSPLLEREILDL